MEPKVTEQRDSSRDMYIGGGCLLLAIVGSLIWSSKPAPASAPAPVVHRAQRSQAAAPTATATVEPRVTFAPTMPRAHGTQVYNNTGGLNPDVVSVAIPDESGGVRFVRGSDPRAIEYLATVKEKQSRLVVDKGPRDVDMSEIADFGPLKGRTTRRVRNLSADPK